MSEMDVNNLTHAKRAQKLAMLCEGSSVRSITDRQWSLNDVIAKIDELAPAPKVRGPYKKRGAA